MKRFMAWVDRTPVWLFVVLVATLGLSPWVPEPHIAEKVRWLLAGELARPMDVFDLVLHAVPWLLLGLKLGRETWKDFGPRPRSSAADD